MGGRVAVLPPAAPPSPRRPVRASSGKRYGFNCGYCSSRLEAYEDRGGSDGVCPTCGNEITIPIRNRYGQLIDPKTREIIKQNPHPVHAYAAAGGRAPKILRDDVGSQAIICPKCNTRNPITSNCCRACGTPFTIEGTTQDIAGANNSSAVTSLIMGILSIPMFCTFFVPILAIIFGIWALVQMGKQEDKSSNKWATYQSYTGIALGSLGLVWAAYRSLR